MSNFEQEAYHDKVNSKFAELMYQKMATKRYGIEFCCKEENDKWLLRKELLDFNALKDACPPQCQQYTFGINAGSETVTYIPCTGFLPITEVPADDSIICYNPTYTPTLSGVIPFTEEGACNI